MAHELTINDGVAEMAYAGETPWHGLGQVLERGASIEEWRKAAGMNWTVKQSPVAYHAETDSGIGINSIVNGKKVLYRSDNLAALGVVGSEFEIVQPGDVLEFFRDLTENAGLTLETAGTLFGGRRFWALANIGDECEVVPGDKVGGYLLLCTGADGTLATTGKFTTVRVVCNNTLRMSLDAKNEAKITHRSEFNPALMKAQLGIAHEAFRAFGDNARQLARKTIKADDARVLTRLLLLPTTYDSRSFDDQMKIAEATENSQAFGRIMDLFGGKGKGADIDGVGETAWGWLNATTEYVDHLKRAKSLDHRLEAAWFGKGDEIKGRALQLANQWGA